MKQVFETSVGAVEVRVDHESRTIGAYRYDDEHRAAAAAIEAWDYVDLADVFSRQLGVPPREAIGIAAAVRELISAPSLAQRLRGTRHDDVDAPAPGTALRTAGLLRRWAAVVLDGVIVLFPLAIVLGLMSGGGYAERSDGSAEVGVVLAGRGFWLFLLLAIAYYAFGEALTGATLGKRIVRIRVVDEQGEHPTLGAAVVRNLLRPVDALFFYLVGGVVALASPRRQRLGDRIAHTVVVRR